LANPINVRSFNVGEEEAAAYFHGEEAEAEDHVQALLVLVGVAFHLDAVEEQGVGLSCQRHLERFAVDLGNHHPEGREEARRSLHYVHLAVYRHNWQAEEDHRDLQEVPVKVVRLA
jgi:hypothetical protein